MKISAREMILGVGTLATVLFGGTMLLVQPRLEALAATRESQARVRDQIARSKRLVGSEAKWARRFEELKDMLPVQPADSDIAVHWLSVMDRAASKHGVRITRHSAGEEEPAGDVFELPIDAREWQGDLKAMVRFLFELQSEGAMLDVRYLQMKSTGPGRLRGRFTLYCAYMKSGEE